MKVFRYPNPNDWPSLCKRPSIDQSELQPKVQAVLDDVKLRRDEALIELTAKFDKVELKSLILTVPNSVEIDLELKSAIDVAWKNIHAFHAAQQSTPEKVETTQGVFCWRKSIAIEKVGLYIPGGSAPLFSTLLMLGIPATIAGCKEIVVCTPPSKTGSVDSAILYVAQKLGLKQIYTVGGAQAIAAMTFGTDSIPKVDKIFGPGNQYVTMAKQLIQQNGLAIDMPAGPSEVLVIADESCEPAFVAADLLSQAEHGPDSQVVLVVVGSENVLSNILLEVEEQLEQLPRKEIAELALKNSSALLVNTSDEAMSFSNHYAPEHLILAVKNADELAEKVVNAGSVFIGNYSCESAGDYASGTNHTLPTNGYARSYSGVSLDSFVKKVTFQKLSAEGIQNIGPSIETMASAEQLDAHRNAVTVRLKKLQNG
ncbi:MAG: histidinol dehydrogenase [Flavobacteriales bacterium]|jgi:histidinol dehydrogenase|nr:histidinol dehydrogenase [Flavobacteriales bacterium]